MITKLISDIGLNKKMDNTLFLIYYTDHIIKRMRTIRRRAKKKKNQFSLFNNTYPDTFANFVSKSNLHKLTGLPFSSALSRMHDECSYEE